MTDTLAHLRAALADRYATERELGSGGMVTVYLAHDLKHGRKVATWAVLLGLIIMHSTIGSGQPPQQGEPQASKVADVPYPLAVSPDGQFLVEYGNRGSLTVRDLATGEARSLTNRDYPELVGPAAVAPGGGLIAYAWHNGHEFDELRLIGTDGSDERVLFRDWAVRSVIVWDWTDDGTLILAGMLRFDSTAGFFCHVIAVDTSLDAGHPQPILDSVLRIQSQPYLHSLTWAWGVVRSYNSPKIHAHAVRFPYLLIAFLICSVADDLGVPRPADLAKQAGRLARCEPPCYTKKCA